MPTKLELLHQLQSLRTTGFADMLARHATAHNFPIPYFFAIASRETNCVNELGDKGKDGKFHGVGIVQIDVQHPIARMARDSGSWKTNPEPLIEFGAAMLAGNIKSVKRTFPAFDELQALKVAASGYNAGLTGAIAAAKQGDSDTPTAHGNYGKDVINRMAVFEELIAEGH